MAVINQVMAMGALGALKRNQQKLGDQARKVSSGEAFPDSHYGPEVYSISEKMRVQIKALDQNDENTKKGQDMLKVAEGGLQSQLDMMRQIKQKVIDAANDTNTDDDRVTIQKEIDQMLDQMETVTYSTKYNGIPLLYGGDEPYKLFVEWQQLSTPVAIQDSDAMNVIPDNYASLDGVTGPFNIFTEQGEYNTTTISELQIPATYSGAASVIKASSVSELADHCVYAGGRYYVFNTDASKNYPSLYTKLQIDPNGSVADAYQRLASASGVNFTITTENGVTSAETTSYISTTSSSASTATEAIPGCGITQGYLSGGTDAIVGDGRDIPDIPGTQASYSGSISNKTVGSGFTISGIQFVFEEGSSAPRQSGNQYKIGVDWTGTATVGNFTITIGSNQSISVTYNNVGSYGNYYYVSDGIPGSQNSDAVYSTNITGTNAYADIDISGFNTNDLTTAENFINQLQDKYIQWLGSSAEFIDSRYSSSYEAMNKYSYGYDIDLNDLRTAVQNGTTISEAFADLMNGKSYVSILRDDSGNATGVRFTSPYSGAGYNGSRVNAYDANLRHYTIDYKSWFSNNPNFSIPDDLNGKGFRFYCASDQNQWFNVTFRTGDNADRPESGSDDSLDFRSIDIDVSNVTDSASLVQAIYDQGEPIMSEIDHYLHFAANPDLGTITIYEPYNASRSQSNLQRLGIYQQLGAKIADGSLDTVVKIEKQTYAKRLVIQDTEKSNSYITLHIPQTTLDHVFYMVPEPKTIKDYSVVSRSDRDDLLGKNDGILDHGINYLLDAITEVGAQMKRVELSNSNIVTKRENAQASESTIRDADMAKEMVEYTKSNLLSQAAQSMLAQANQNMAHVLELLR